MNGVNIQLGFGRTVGSCDPKESKSKASHAFSADSLRNPQENRTSKLELIFKNHVNLYQGPSY